MLAFPLRGDLYDPVALLEVDRLRTDPSEVKAKPDARISVLHMGSGISFPGSSKAQASAQPSGCSGVSEREPRTESADVQTKTKMDARIVDTLRELNMTRRAAPEKVKTMNFQRIVLKFGIARDAFSTIRTLYDTFAKVGSPAFPGLVSSCTDSGAASLGRWSGL